MHLPKKTVSTKKSYSEYLSESREIGKVVKVFHPVVYAEGLPEVGYHEIVIFDTGDLGFVTSLEHDLVEILSLSQNPICVDRSVTRTKQYLSISVGEKLIGKSIDPLGVPLNENELTPKSEETRLVDIPSEGISSRERITESFETGTALVDLMIPLGKGQRELIIGDRKTGKTEFLMQTMLTQARQGTLVIYAGIGKKRTDILKIESFIKKYGLKDNAVVISSSASDPLGLIYLTPYSAMTIAEYFKDQGRDTFVILDDLTTHAKYYREVSLISRKFPGREAYPGDIFYAHARLLERAGCFTAKSGKKVALTCFPVAETIGGDISGYIQTNLMSITDGHIFFDGDLFKKGQKPSINQFLSITRVGRQTQSKLRWGVNRELTSFLTLYNKTQNFVHFGAELNEGIKATLAMGDKLISFFNQPIKEIVPVKVQILFYCLVWIGAFQSGENDRVRSLLLKSAHLYQKDRELTEKIDQLVIESDDFNKLLGKVSSQYANLINFLESKHAGK